MKNTNPNKLPDIRKTLVIEAPIQKVWETLQITEYRDGFGGVQGWVMRRTEVGLMECKVGWIVRILNYFSNGAYYKSRPPRPAFIEPLNLPA